MRSVAVGLLLAAVAFGYATATSRSTDVSVAGSSRAVGSSVLRFTNVLLVDRPAPQADDFDLGDAFYGSVITRYITATGGVRPYRYSGGATGLGANSTFAIFTAGLAQGSIATGTASPLSVGITVSDSFGTSTAGALAHVVNSNFIINLFTPASGTFRFAIDRINNGVLGQSYISKLETLGGNEPVVFTIVPNTLAVNGVLQGVATGLEGVGLSLAQDGTIFGRPLISGQISFTARATDGLKRIALGRSSGVQDQLISFNIEESTVTASDFVTLSCKVKGDLGKAGKDSINFSGHINLAGAPINALQGFPFSLRLGGASFEGRFNAKGQVVNSRGGPAVFANGALLKAGINARSGQLKGSVTRASLGSVLNATNIVDRSTQRLALEVMVASSAAISYSNGTPVGIIGSDMIEFVSRRSGNKFSLDYKLASVGRPLGGAFQILSVKGNDVPTVSGEAGDQWHVRFLAVPRFGIDANAGLDAISTLGVRIGSFYNLRLSSQNLTTSGNGNIKLIPQKNPGPVLSKFSLNTRKFVGSLSTNSLSARTTGIPQAFAEALRLRDANNLPGEDTLAFFSLGLDIDRTGTNTDFTGEAGRGIYLPDLAMLYFNPVTGATPNPKRKAKTYWADQSNQR